MAFVHLPFSFRSFHIFVASLLFMKGTSFFFCYKEKIELLDRVMANSAVICMSLRGVWHLYNLPCVSVLFWLISIARYIFKSPRICFWGKKIRRLPWKCCLLALYIVTPGPAMIRTVLQVQQINSFHGYHICLPTCFFGDVVGLLQIQMPRTVVV